VLHKEEARLKSNYIWIIGAMVLVIGGGGVQLLSANMGHDMAGHEMKGDAMAGHDMSTHDMASMSPWAMAYAQANDTMHQGMMVPYSDNPDLDFARGMVPHHQGAVEMAKIQLEHGTDPEMRKLAQEVIAAQEVEIQFMKDWIAKNQ
jgi:uncharacterized protein (DUF305 family)